MTDNIEPGSRDAEEASPDVRRDDDDAPSIATILASIRARSEAEKAALRDASGDRENTALPGPFARSSLLADAQTLATAGSPTFVYASLWRAGQAHALSAHFVMLLFMPLG